MIWYEDGDVVNGWYGMGMWLMGGMVWGCGEWVVCYGDVVNGWFGMGMGMW